MVNPYTDSVDRIFVKRDRYDIIAKILDIANTENGKKPTHIMYKGNLNSRQLHEYLSFLIEKGLITRIAGNPSEKYKTTPKGVEYLESYNESKTLLTI